MWAKGLSGLLVKQGPGVSAREPATTYWAAEPDSERAAALVLERVKRFRDWLRASGRAERMWRSWRAFYGRAPDGMGDTSRITADGSQGEWVGTTTNDFAQLVTQTAVLTTQTRPAFKVVPTNSDSKSLAQASFAQGLLAYYDKLHNLDDRDRETVLGALLTSEAWRIGRWDNAAGEALTEFMDDGPAVRAGDIGVHVTTSFRCAYDAESADIDSLQWFAFARRYNRFDLAAQVEKRSPETARKLRGMSADAGDVADEWDNPAYDLKQAGLTSTASSDLVLVWEFRHLPTPALPNGRVIRFVGNQCVVFDTMEALMTPEGAPLMGESGPMFKDHGYPYGKRLQANRLSPEITVDSVAGHTAVFDLLGLQELMDTLATIMATAANAGGVSNLWTPLGDKPSITAMVGAMNFLQSKNKPEILEGVKLDPMVAEVAGFMGARMMRRLGQSEVSQGEVPKGMPGNLAALLEAKTVQFNSQLQSAYSKLLERSRNDDLDLLKRFAKAPRIAALGGKSNTWKHKEWSSPDLDGADRFVVEAVNPLSQTMAGRMDAAQQLLDHGLITAEDFLLVRETGRLEPALEAAQAAMMRIQKEREMLQDGIGLAPVDETKSLALGLPQFVDDGKPHIRPYIYDQHWLDIPEAIAVGAMPEARDNPEIQNAVNGVVEERLRLMKLMDPVMLAVLKCPPEVAQAIMMSRMPMMPPGAPGESAPTPPAKEKPKQPETPGLPAGAPPIAAAKPPQNPLTGEKPPSPIAGGALG